MINILIVEDDKYIQEHFVKLFTADERFHLVGAVRDAFEAERLCNKGIDLVLMDVQTTAIRGLPPESGLRRAAPIPRW